MRLSHVGFIPDHVSGLHSGFIIEPSRRNKGIMFFPYWEVHFIFKSTSSHGGPDLRTHTAAAVSITVVNTVNV